MDNYSIVLLSLDFCSCFVCNGLLFLSYIYLQLLQHSSANNSIVFLLPTKLNISLVYRFYYTCFLTYCLFSHFEVCDHCNFQLVFMENRFSIVFVANIHLFYFFSRSFFSSLHIYTHFSLFCLFNTFFSVEYEGDELS